MRTFEKWKNDRVSIDENVLAGEPTFTGTRLSVRHVGGMILAGASKRLILVDYPYLDSEDLEFAKKYTEEVPGRTPGR